MPSARYFGATQRRPGRSVQEMVAAYEELGDIGLVVAEFHCSPKAVKAALRAVGIQSTPQRVATSSAPPPTRYRCPCCNQVRSSPTCPETGEVFCAAFAVH